MGKRRAWAWLFAAAQLALSISIVACNVAAKKSVNVDASKQPAGLKLLAPDPARIVELELDTSATSTFSLNPMFADRAVLQRNKPVRVFGRGPNSAEVTVELRDARGIVVRTQTARVANFNWSASLESYAGTGAHSLTVRSGSYSETHTGIAIGEVYLCSGQSNAILNIKDSDVKNLLAVDPDLRLYQIFTQRYGPVKFTAPAGWDAYSGTSTLASYGGHPALCYAFAKKLRELTGVPVGMLVNPWPGTAIEEWIRPGRISTAPALSANDTNTYGATYGGLYNQMMRPILGGTFRGLLWYQGETNSGNPTGPEGSALRYLSTQTILVSDLRRLQNDDFDAVFVQLANPSSAVKGELSENALSYFREAQRRSQVELPKSDLITAMDLGGFAHDSSGAVTRESNRYAVGDVHSTLKKDVGYRAAFAAKKLIDAGVTENQLSPKLVSAIKDGAGFVVSLDQNVATQAGTNTAANFDVCCLANAWVKATAATYVNAKTLRVMATQVAAPSAVRYSWVNGAASTLVTSAEITALAIPQMNLRNSAGLPVLPFTTENDWSRAGLKSLPAYYQPLLEILGLFRDPDTKKAFLRGYTCVKHHDESIVVNLIDSKQNVVASAVANMDLAGTDNDATAATCATVASAHGFDLFLTADQEALVSSQQLSLSVQAPWGANLLTKPITALGASSP